MTTLSNSDISVDREASTLQENEEQSSKTDANVSDELTPKQTQFSVPLQLSPEKVLDHLLGDEDSDEIELDRDNENVSYDVDFYQISFDEVDDRISEFREDEFVREAFEKGMDLREYARQLEEELYDIERDHELDYMNQVHNFIDLHTQIKSCDEILENMENLLNIFQADLGNISSEIQTLQDKSHDMSMKLKNRTAVETKLGNILEGIVVPPEMIRKIIDVDIDETWLAYLLDLNKKMQYVRSNTQQPRQKKVRAVRNVGPALENLRLRAAASIRDFFLLKIKQLRIPNTNVQIMQQNVLLKYKELNYFIMERHSGAAAEISGSYINTMKWYFSFHFEKYAKSLMKLQMVVAEKGDLIGAEEGAKKGFESIGNLFGTNKPTFSNKANVLALGNRIDTLRNHDAGVILVHVADEKNKKYPNEALFRSFNLTFIDNASSEYLFLTEFFAGDDANAVDIASKIFREIFEPTEAIGQQTTKSFVDSSYDAVGILLCIRINTQLALELQQRRVPTLENYAHATNMLLWPRFQHIMDLHVDSVKKMQQSKSVIAAVKEVHPHYVTRRYAEFAASILTLNEEYDDAILTNSLQRLRNEVEALLVRMSNELHDQKLRMVFMINNDDLILSIVQETGSKAVEAEVEHFRTLLATHISSFVDLELQPSFGGLINFVIHAEKLPDVSGIDSDRLEQISSQFNSTWRQALTMFNSDIIQYFSNFKNGTTVLQAVLGQLIVYYTRFYTLLEKRFPGGAGTMNWKQPPVGVQTVMVEIKSKFRNTF